jgi:hypothetical protein
MMIIKKIREYIAATAEFDGGSCLDLGPSRKEPCPIASGLD